MLWQPSPHDFLGTLQQLGYREPQHAHVGCGAAATAHADSAEQGAPADALIYKRLFNLRLLLRLLVLVCQSMMNSA